MSVPGLPLYIRACALHLYRLYTAAPVLRSEGSRCSPGGRWLSKCSSDLLTLDAHNTPGDEARDGWILFYGIQAIIEGRDLVLPVHKHQVGRVLCPFVNSC